MHLDINQGGNIYGYFIYYIYEKSVKDKLSQLTIYKVSPLHLTHHVSSNPTNITLPPSSLSLFPSGFSNIRAPPPLLSSYYSTSSSSSSYESNILALCGNISFQISFPNFKNYLSSQSSSSSYGFSLLSFIFLVW